jgi:hypothetical protein
LARDIEARRRGADDLVGGGRLRLHLTLGDEIVAKFAAPAHRQIEIAPADQLAIAQFARRVAQYGDDATPSDLIASQLSRRSDESGGLT